MKIETRYPLRGNKYRKIIAGNVNIFAVADVSNAINTASESWNMFCSVA